MTRARGGGPIDRPPPNPPPPNPPNPPRPDPGPRPAPTPDRTIGDSNQSNPLLHDRSGRADDPHTIDRRSLMAKRPTPDRDDQPNTDSNETTSGPRELPLVALRETVIFPEMIVPLQVGREKSVNALNAAVADGGPIALVTQRHAEQEDISEASELYEIGTLAKIAQVVQLQDGTVRAIVQGQGRLRVVGFTGTEPYLRATTETLDDESPSGLEVQALMRTVQAQIEQYVANGAPVPPEAAVAARNISEPGLLADMV